MESNKMKPKTQSPCKCQSRWFLSRHWDANKPFEFWTVFGGEKPSYKNMCQEKSVARIQQTSSQLAMKNLDVAYRKNPWRPKSNKTPIEIRWTKILHHLKTPQTNFDSGAKPTFGAS